MFYEMVRDFDQRINEQGPAVARLAVNGQLSRVRVTYHREDVLEIRGLPPDAPPTLLLSPERVLFGSNGEGGPEPGSQAEAFYKLYSIWDPRVIVRGLRDEEHLPEGRWRAVFALSDAVRSRRILEVVREDQLLREVQYVIEEGRLVELSLWDFDPTRTLLTLGFEG